MSRPLNAAEDSYWGAIESGVKISAGYRPNADISDLAGGSGRMRIGDGNSTDDFTGVWWLLSREDRARDGSVRIDPTLGPDAKGILTYANGRFAAQFMKRDRSDLARVGNPSSGQNNTGAVGGYDAYFGTYSINADTGDVLHRLEGALTPENVGVEVLRTLTVSGDNLVIQLETTTPEGEPVTRTLIWERVA